MSTANISNYRQPGAAESAGDALAPPTGATEYALGFIAEQALTGKLTHSQIAALRRLLAEYEQPAGAAAAAVHTGASNAESPTLKEEPLRRNGLFAKYNFKILEDGFVEFTLPAGASYAQLFTDANAYCADKANGRGHRAMHAGTLKRFSGRKEATSVAQAEQIHQIQGFIQGSRGLQDNWSEDLLRAKRLCFPTTEAAAAAAVLYYCATGNNLLGRVWIRTADHDLLLWTDAGGLGAHDARGRWFTCCKSIGSAGARRPVAGVKNVFAGPLQQVDGETPAARADLKRQVDLFSKYGFEVLEDGFVAFTLPEGASYLDLFKDADAYCADAFGASYKAIRKNALEKFTSRADATEKVKVDSRHEIQVYVPESDNKTRNQQKRFLYSAGLTVPTLEAATAAAVLYFCSALGSLIPGFSRTVITSDPHRTLSCHDHLYPPGVGECIYGPIQKFFNMDKDIDLGCAGERNQRS